MFLEDKASNSAYTVIPQNAICQCRPGWNLCTLRRRSSARSLKILGVVAWDRLPSQVSAQVVKALVASLISFWSHLWRGKAKFGIICDLGVTFNNDWRIFGIRFTRIPPWNVDLGCTVLVFPIYFIVNIWSLRHAIWSPLDDYFDLISQVWLISEGDSLLQECWLNNLT